MNGIRSRQKCKYIAYQDPHSTSKFNLPTLGFVIEDSPIPFGQADIFYLQNMGHPYLHSNHSGTNLSSSLVHAC